MENASKALIIAGSVLLALLAVSLFMYVMGNIKTLQESQELKLYQEQLVAFNREYEAYNKSLLYGTDVITVVNKAIQNNLNMNNVEHPADRYYVNVIIKTTPDKEYKTRITKENLTEANSKEEDLNNTDIINLLSLAPAGITLDSTEAKLNDTTELGSWTFEGYFHMDSGILSFFNQDATDTVFDIETNRYRVYSALTEFKRTIFTCDKMEYSGDEGRVKEITFIELKEESH